MSGDDDESCTCDVCATDWHTLTGAQKLERVVAEREQHTAEYWRTYAEQLEAENYELTRDLREAEDALAEERARCQNCGRHK